MKAGLGLPDIHSWNMIEKIAERNNLGYKQLVSQNAMFAVKNFGCYKYLFSYNSFELSLDET
jgi:hypothetical protein